MRCTRSLGPRGFFCLQVDRRGPVIADVIRLMQELDDILTKATAAVSELYFYLDIAEDDPVVRERVYCYELYHQMRLQWPAGSEHALHGEIDKAGHKFLQTLGVNRQKPDLLVHGPGGMDQNNTIIEVKNHISERESSKDLKTLDLFVSNVHYDRGVYLIYGDHEREAVICALSGFYAELGLKSQIELWLHRRTGEPACLVKTLAG